MGLLSEKDEPKSSQGQVNVLILVIEANYFSYLVFQLLVMRGRTLFCRANKLNMRKRGN